MSTKRYDILPIHNVIEICYVVKGNFRIMDSLISVSQDDMILRYTGL